MGEVGVVIPAKQSVVLGEFHGGNMEDLWLCRQPKARAVSPEQPERTS